MEMDFDPQSAEIARKDDSTEEMFRRMIEEFALWNKDKAEAEIL